jgi:alkylation response protein AidB-like acyl-CoA dehydrogenase
MDFSIADTTRALLEKVRAFVRNEVIPLEKRLLSETFAALLPDLEIRRQRVREAGLWGPQIPQSLGGMGLGFMEHALVSEELGRSPLGHFVFNCQAPDAGNMEILAEFGSEEQKERYLAPLAAGRIRSCFSMTEPDRPGSNPVWMNTRAERDGDDYVINGRKWFTSAADGSTFAIVMAVTNPDAPPHERASQIIVPTSTPGFNLIRNVSVMGHAGDGWPSHSEIVYENCRVPVSNLLGKEGSGFAIAQARLGPGRIHHCMRWIGICERSFDVMCKRAITRELSPGEPLAFRQTIQNWVADSRAEINAARLMVLNAAWKIDKEGSKAAAVEISTIKFYVANVLQSVVDRAIQTCGAYGLTDDDIIAYFYRGERAARIYDGPDEVHKAVVARKILKSYAGL